MLIMLSAGKNCKMLANFTVSEEETQMNLASIKTFQQNFSLLYDLYNYSFAKATS